MLEERCWRSDAGRLRLQQWHQSHHGISAPTHQGASICKQRRAAVLTFRGGCSGCCSWIRRSYLAFIIGVISSQPSAADAPSRRAAEDEQGQENDEGLGHIGWGDISTQYMTWIWGLGPRLFPQARFPVAKA